MKSLLNHHKGENPRPYGCNSLDIAIWLPVKVENIKRPSAFDHSCLRYNLYRYNLTFYEYVKRIKSYAASIIHLHSNTTCINIITEYRLRWLEYILRRPPKELKYIPLLTESCGDWRQQRGEPIKNMETNDMCAYTMEKK